MESRDTDCSSKATFFLENTDYSAMNNVFVDYVFVYMFVLYMFVSLDHFHYICPNFRTNDGKDSKSIKA